MFVQLFESVFSTFGTVVTSLADGVKTAFTYLVYAVEYGADGSVTVATEGGLSNLVRFGFAVGGFALAIGVVYGIFGLIRGKARDRG